MARTAGAGMRVSTGFEFADMTMAFDIWIGFGRRLSRRWGQSSPVHHVSTVAWAIQPLRRRSSDLDGKPPKSGARYTEAYRKVAGQ
jgi:hypothetical protein